MLTSPSSWRTCDAAAYESLRSDMREAIRLAIPELVAGRRDRGLSELLELLWAVDGFSRSSIDDLAAKLPAPDDDGTDRE